jgi:hypothetical protein
MTSSPAAWSHAAVSGDPSTRAQTTAGTPGHCVQTAQRVNLGPPQLWFSAQAAWRRPAHHVKRHRTHPVAGHQVRYGLGIADSPGHLKQVNDHRHSGYRRILQGFAGQHVAPGARQDSEQVHVKVGSKIQARSVEKHVRVGLDRRRQAAQQRRHVR